MPPRQLQPIATLRRSVLAGETSVLALVGDFLEQISKRDATLHGFSSVVEADALRQAAAIDNRLRDSRTAGRLVGAVISIKDIIDVAGAETTCCSRSRFDATARADALLVRRLRDEGAVILGKANCHEFAFGGPSFDLPFPPARNPWNPELFPGGSSSGSGVAVAAGLGNASIGTDTAGSIRLPSTHCGVVGLKPTYGAVSLRGVQPLAGSMDCAGPLARNVDDCRRIFEVIGSQRRGASTQDILPNWHTGDLQGLRVGVVDDAWGLPARCEPAVASAYEQVHQCLSKAGVSFVPLNPPGLERLHAASSVIMMAEVAANYAGEIRGNFGAYGEVFRNRALLGEIVKPRHYRQAQQERAAAVQAFDHLFTQADLILMPGSFGLPGPLQVVDKFYFLKAPNINAVANLIGCPALALPTMLAGDGVPTGVQLMGQRHSEHLLLAAGEGLERRLGFGAYFQ